MTRRFHRRIFAPKRLRPWAVDSDYGRHPLDAQKLEVMPHFHRDCGGDDPWMSPEKSEAIQALLIHVESAQVHAPLFSVSADSGLDLEAFCQDAELTERQTQVVLMVGEGLGVREIARALELHHSTVAQHLAFGRHKLAGFLPTPTWRVILNGVRRIWPKWNR